MVIMIILVLEEWNIVKCKVEGNIFVLSFKNVKVNFLSL